MSRFFFCTICFFLLTGCDSGIPKNILPPAKMQSLLWDFMRADEMTAYYAIRDTSIARSGKYTAYYQNILQMHGITKQDFKKSLQYYKMHPELFKIVLDSLQSQTERVQKLADSSKRKFPGDTSRAATPAPIEKRKIPALPGARKRKLPVVKRH